MEASISSPILVPTYQNTRKGISVSRSLKLVGWCRRCRPDGRPCTSYGCLYYICSCRQKKLTQSGFISKVW